MRCPFWKSKSLDCEYFRWVDEMPTVADSSFSAEAQSLGVDNDEVMQQLRVIIRKVEVVEPRISWILFSFWAVCVLFGLYIILSCYLEGFRINLAPFH
ncbi:hypothetical protein LINGRAHAP2_LOCUS15907 [Linum grandiflorum]